MDNNVVEYIIRAKDITKGTLATSIANIKKFAFTVGRNLFNIQAGFNMLKKGAMALAKPLATAFRREAITIQFAVLFRSLKQAKTHMKDLADFAAKTPFQLNGIAAASRKLHIFSSGLLGGKDTLRLVGDAASATGNSLEELSFWVGRAYSMIAAGKPFGEAALRLQELGVLTPQVRQKMEDLQKSGASTSQVWMQLRNSLEQYEGGMKIASQSGEGLISTLKDVGTEAQNTFGKSFMASAKGGIQYFIDLINGLIGDGTIEAWAEKTKTLLLSVFGAMKGLSSASTRADAWGAIKDIVIGGFELGASKAINLLSQSLPLIGVTFGRAIKNAIMGKGENRQDNTAVARSMGIITKKNWLKYAITPTKMWDIPDSKKDEYNERTDYIKASKYKMAQVDESHGIGRINRGKNTLKAMWSGFEQAGLDSQLTDEDFKRKSAGATSPERTAQRKKEIAALAKIEAEMKVSEDKKRIEEEKAARIKLEQDLSSERKRLQRGELQQKISESTKAEQSMASRLDRARAKVAQTWGWYRDKDSLRAQIEEEKTEAAAQKQFDKDFYRLKSTKRDWRTVKNLSLDQEAVRRVGVAREEEAAAKRAVLETAENTRRLNEKFDAVISMKGGE